MLIERLGKAHLGMRQLIRCCSAEVTWDLEQADLEYILKAKWREIGMLGMFLGYFLQGEKRNSGSEIGSSIFYRYVEENPACW